MIHRILLLACAAISWASSLANTYTVTKTVDNSNSGSLRWAITQANANAGYDIINFNIPSSGGNTFETSGTNAWALITLGSALPTITETVLIDGTTQTNTNTGAAPGQTVGVDGFVQSGINYPDVYIVCGYTLPNTESSTVGNGFFIDAANVTIKGLAISGFGNTNSTQASAVGHADISIHYSATPRVMNTIITDCFISCNPRGQMPSPASRLSKSGSILILANNNNGTIQHNYIAYAGAYGIIFHGSVDNSSSTPNLAPSRCWLIQENQIIGTGLGTTYTATSRAGDAISMMCVRSTAVKFNYIDDWEQFAIDMGHNADSNRIENNTITGFTKTAGTAPCGGIRTAFSSQRDSVIKNSVCNNTSASNLAGIWADQTQTTFAGGVARNDSLFYYAGNEIHDNTNSGIVLSTNGTGTLSRVTITQNSIFSNTGLGIDLGYAGTAGPTMVTVNDNGDGDAGVNDLQNFPIIDSVKYNASAVRVWGKGPGGSTIEFYTTDGQLNRHGGRILNYGEGKSYIGTGVEGSVSDYASGTASYNSDGNTAVNNANFFHFVLPFTGIVNTDSVTATATVNGNTSEFGPVMFAIATLDCNLICFNGNAGNGQNLLNWKAITDQGFSYFQVEHSADGRCFLPLAKVFPFSIASSESQRYSYCHQIGSAGKHYYRLKMVGIDGSLRYSNVLLLENDDCNGFAIKALENPIRGRLALQIASAMSGKAQVTIVSATGAIVGLRFVQVERGTNQFYWNLQSQLAPGSYQIIGVLEDKKASISVVKQ